MWPHLHTPSRDGVDEHDRIGAFDPLLFAVHIVGIWSLATHRGQILSGETRVEFLGGQIGDRGGVTGGRAEVRCQHACGRTGQRLGLRMREQDECVHCCSRYCRHKKSYS